MITLCFHTRDAELTSEGSFTFTMPNENMRNDALKVALASCEFPMILWTIEESWNRCWYNEGIRCAVADSYVDVVVKMDGTLRAPQRLHLPPRFNAIMRHATASGRFVFECEHIHGLHSLGPQETVRVIGAPGGDVVASIKDLILDDSEKRLFSIPAERKLELGNGCPLTLLVPTLRSPAHLCECMTRAAACTLIDGLKLHFDYDGKDDRIIIHGIAPSTDAVVRLLPSPLMQRCGISTHPVNFENSFDAYWPSESTRFWQFAEVPCGFYGPCHRPMSIGQPLRFGPELEKALNRLYFPLTPKDASEGHNLVFCDPDGHALSCSIASGRYSAETLSRALEDGMTQACSKFTADVSFGVRITEDHRFVFSCERKIYGRVRAAPFSILFNHPLSMDSTRLGFAPQPLTGSCSYTSSMRVQVITTGNMIRAPTNILRVSEHTCQKRFRLSVAPPITLDGEVFGTLGASIAVLTSVNGAPFAHGLHAGDIVRIVAIPRDSATVSTTAHIPRECTCIVDVPSNNPCALALKTPPIVGLSEKGTSVQIIAQNEPWNMHFGKLGTIPAEVIGFPCSAVQWGLDGSVTDELGLHLPPFEAPFVHILEHPNYVIMDFSESSGTHLSHSYGSNTSAIFCKLSLYPQFREERMLPRDTTLMRSHLNKFTLSFRNPNGTPYHFHGTQFSFSLNFVTTQAS